MANYAVCVDGAYKSYGSKPVLNDYSMKVPRGCIYGLLGASGCGKTTLLSCVVGRKQFDSGNLWVMGGKPGEPGSGVPGPRVGYMPQEIALVDEFTVKDAVYYFGRILNMKDSAIHERFQMLKQLLDLPPDDRYLKNCSGGQQRRVSFAAAMVHSPELLILDEPTVGLDPVLRNKIWTYLVKIAETERTAIIITTHYIEEARQAHRIGLMREGRLLAEDSPERLLALFQTDTLEEAFLILCKQQEEGRLAAITSAVADDQNNSLIMSRAQSDASIITMDIGHGSKDILTPVDKRYTTTTGPFSLNGKRFKSLLSKNTKQFLRNTGGMAFTLAFPIIEMLCFLYAVGGHIKNIDIGIVNDESMVAHCSNYTKNGTTIPYSFSNCYFNDLGCRFLDEMQDPMFNMIYYDSVDQAVDSIKHGKIVGVLHMAENFSASFEQRLHDIRKMSDETLENSRINVFMDMSNRQIGATIKYKLYQKYKEFQMQAFDDCNFVSNLGKLPIRFNFEFGDEDESFMFFMVPGVLITVMFFLGTTLTSTIIITDRLEGVWDRSIVAGVSSLEIVLTHFITQFILVFSQAVEVLVLTFFIYGLEHQGPTILIFVFILLQGLTGMVFGFFISVVSNSHNAANIASTGFFYPMILLCGMIWPIEAQPTVLRFVSNCMPFTIPMTSLRNIMKKGDDASTLDTLSGLGVTLAWLLIISIVSIFCIKAKR